MNHRRIRPFVLGILVGVAVNSLAQAPPPKASFDVMSWNATMKQSPATGLRVGALAVQFEKTTLAEIRRAAAIGDIAHQGDAGESVYWLCYTNVGISHVERIWLMADGEMGGPEHYVTGISAELLPNGSATEDCPALPKNFKPVVLDNRLWIGASRGRVSSQLGAPSTRKGTWRTYDFQTKVPGNCEGGSFDREASLWLHFRNGRVNLLHARQTTSC